MADSRKIEEVVMADGGIQQSSHSMLPVVQYYTLALWQVFQSVYVSIR